MNRIEIVTVKIVANNGDVWLTTFDTFPYEKGDLISIIGYSNLFKVTMPWWRKFFNCNIRIIVKEIS